MVLGLTGSTGCGKTSVSNIFKKQGAFVINVDKVYHNLLLNNTDMIAEISNNFNVLDQNLKINRKKLGEIVFFDKEKLNLLNKITHKYILEEIDKLILAYKNLILLDMPLLFDVKYNEKCDKVIGVVAPFEEKINRIMARDNITYSYAENRLKNQKNNDFFIENCDIIINNNKDFKHLESECLKILKMLGVKNGT